MFVPFSTIRKFSLRTPEGDIPLRDIAFSPQTGEITHVICDTGGLLFSQEVCLPVSELGKLDPAAEVWEAESPPDPSGGMSEEFERTAIPLEAMAPVLVGPFGTTQSPMLLAAQWLMLHRSGEVAALPESVERMGDWLGCILFGPTGPLGTIAEFHLDTTSLQTREIGLKVDDATQLILFDAVRNFVSGEGYAVTDLTIADLEAGMTIVEQGPDIPKPPKASWVTSEP